MKSEREQWPGTGEIGSVATAAGKKHERFDGGNCNLRKLLSIISTHFLLLRPVAILLMLTLMILLSIFASTFQHYLCYYPRANSPGNAPLLCRPDLIARRASMHWTGRAKECGRELTSEPREKERPGFVSFVCRDHQFI